MKNKIDYIISDNASNMKKAFKVSFQNHTADDIDIDSDIDDDEQEFVDDEDIWESLPEDEQREVGVILGKHCRKQLLSCFAHSLQLVVSDGLKETKSLRSALGKASRLCTLLHTSCLFKEAFEKKLRDHKKHTGRCVHPVEFHSEAAEEHCCFGVPASK